jgi:hypothetical protein
MMLIEIKLIDFMIMNNYCQFLYLYDKNNLNLYIKIYY